LYVKQSVSRGKTQTTKSKAANRPIALSPHLAALLSLRREAIPICLFSVPRKKRPGPQLSLVAWEASAERAKRKAAVTLYRAIIGLRVLFGGGTIAMLYGAGAVARSDNFRRDWWVSVLLFGLAMFCASQWPADLEISESRIFEKRWFGIRKRVFQWQDVASATSDPVEASLAAAL
jgi:hypothetical protein